jgi:hypothetical protein
MNMDLPKTVIQLKFTLPIPTASSVNMMKLINFMMTTAAALTFIKATAIAGQAGYYANKGEYAKAADLYRKASRVSNIMLLMLITYLKQV